MNAVLSSLYVLPRLGPHEVERAQSVRACLEPLVGEGLLEPIDLHVVTRLARLVDEWDPAVITACAATVRAPRRGHICLDLGGPEPWPQRPESGRPALPWPDPKGLVGRLRASPLVSDPGAQEGERRPFVFDGRRLYSARFYEDQSRLVRGLTALAQGPKIEPDDAQRLTLGLQVLFPPAPGADPAAIDRQQLAGALAALGRLTIVTGGPGMGKTHTVRNVLALLFAQHEVRRAREGGPLRVALAAPTGKAAARIRESLLHDLEGFLVRAAPVVSAPDALQEFLTGLEARTLHRLLGVIPDDPTRFRHNAQLPLGYDVVVVDETSMVDFAMMARLVEAVGPDTRLVLLGDRHQLASVEAGTVLADLCGSAGAGEVALSPQLSLRLKGHGVVVPERDPTSAQSRLSDCVVQLDRTHRFTASSSIGRFAMACLAPDFDAEAAAAPLFDAASPDAARVDPGDGKSLPGGLVNQIVEGYRGLYAHLSGAPPASVEGEPAFHRRALDLFDGFRVLSAHREGPLGVHSLNEAVRQAVAKAWPMDGLDAFWPGRPVLVRRNDYDVGLYNGDIGLVVSRCGVDGTSRRWVAFAGPDALPAEADPADPQWAGLKLVRYVAPSRLPEHETCFALTIHKSQGSEYAHVMVVLPATDSPIVTRELLYTAVTRARQRVTLVAHRGAFVQALRRTVQRASGLRDALQDADHPDP